jgi:hypothetical protein
MREAKPGIPDIVEPLAGEMERRGLAAEMINDFRQLWSQLEPHSRILPCPVCFSIGYIGKLNAIPADRFGNEAVRCDTVMP